MPQENRYWPFHLADWCKRHRIPYRDDELGADGAQTTRASVSKAQIKNFVAFMYGDKLKHAAPIAKLPRKGRSDSIYSPSDLMAFIEQELDPDVTYELVADVW